MPDLNVFEVVPISEFWEMVSMFLGMGMPFFLIGAALIVLQWLLPVIWETIQPLYLEMIGSKKDEDDEDDWHI